MRKISVSSCRSSLPDMQQLLFEVCIKDACPGQLCQLNETEVPCPDDAAFRWMLLLASAEWRF
jgi:hypothetical protein